MRLQIQSIHFTAQPSLKTFIEAKIQKLSTFYSPILGCDVFLKLENDSKKENKIIDIKLEISGSRLFSESRASSFESATDDAVEGLRRQLRRIKGKKSV